MKPRFLSAFVLTVCLSPLRSATLERLSLDDMINKSTAIVRGKVTASHVSFSRPIIYTHYMIQVTEQFKGDSRSTVDLVVPGGVANNVRQSFPGTPDLKAGDEFVFFLWTGRSGQTQIVGLTQGLFALAPGASSGTMATRAASKELMLERGTGQQVKDQTLVMSLSDLRARISGTLSDILTVPERPQREPRRLGSSFPRTLRIHRLPGAEWFALILEFRRSEFHKV